jgi:hypothetical protein
VWQGASPAVVTHAIEWLDPLTMEEVFFHSVQAGFGLIATI